MWPSDSTILFIPETNSSRRNCTRTVSKNSVYRYWRKMILWIQIEWLNVWHVSSMPKFDWIIAICISQITIPCYQTAQCVYHGIGNSNRMATNILFWMCVFVLRGLILASIVYCFNVGCVICSHWLHTNGYLTLLLLLFLLWIILLGVFIVLKTVHIFFKE